MTITPYGAMPTPEGTLLLLAIDRPFGIACQCADPKSALARFYTVRKNLPCPEDTRQLLEDLSFRQVGLHEVWIMRKERRAELKLEGPMPDAS